MIKQHFLRRSGALALALALSASLILPAAAEPADGATWEPLTVGQDPANTDATQPPITDLILNESGRILEPGRTMQLTVTVQPEEADGREITWHSGEPDVAKVDPSGLVTAVGPGETKIWAEAGGKKSNECPVTVSGIRFETSSVFLTAGETYDIVYGQYGNAAINVAGTLRWSSDRTGVAMVSGGKVSAQNPGDATITATAGRYTATCYVMVKENTANTIDETMIAGGVLSFGDLRDELDANCREATNSSLRCLTNLTVPTDQGVLYYRYVSGDDTGLGVGSTEQYYYSDSVLGGRGLADVAFVPQADFNGTAVIHYTGYGINGAMFTGKIRVRVEGGSDVSYTTPAGTPVSFQAADFSAICRERLGRDMSYVTFEQPQANRGTLYYNYAGQGGYSEEVSGETRYNRTRNPYLDDVAFVPAEGYTGTVRVSYRCVDTAGSAFQGRVTITVTENRPTGIGDVTYSVGQGEHVDFRASDFNDLSLEWNDASLHYVKFELPDSSQGTLYYNYQANGDYDSKVSGTTRYYRSGRPSISNISFVPRNGYSGTVYIGVTGYDVDGARFEGRVCVNVDGSGGYGEVHYSGQAGKPLTFAAADFNEACLNANGERLNYIRVELPSTSEGTLYYGYTSGGNYSSKVSAGAKYYRSGTPSLSRVTFVPGRSFRGTASIGFAGYDTTGTRFSGTVEIDVTEAVEPTIRYTAERGGAVTFDTADFNRLSRDLTGSSLNYVRFEPPVSRKGTLCYRYDREDGSCQSKATASTSYYRSGGSRLLDDVTFVPGEISGLVEIPFTGWSTDGDKFYGTVEVQVTARAVPTLRYTGSAAPIRIYGEDLRNACENELGRELSYLQFKSLPSAYAGRLYLGYTSPASTGTEASTGVRYYSGEQPGIDSFRFVARAGYQGTVTIPYTGVDTRGRQFEGAIEITAANKFCPNRFSDMERHAWAKPAVEFLYQSGMTSGVTATRFGPAYNITRGDFVLMLCQAFQFRTGSQENFPDVPADSYYAWAIAAAKELGIATSSNGQFMPKRLLTRQEAMVMIKRALIADGWSVPDGDLSLLSNYVDGGTVSDYAKDAVCTLIQLGAVTGNDARQLKPKDPISRAEMAVILHHVLTL